MNRTAFLVVSSMLDMDAVESRSSPKAMLMHGKETPPIMQKSMPTASMAFSAGP
jgi:hypothetical protein